MDSERPTSTRMRKYRAADGSAHTHNCLLRIVCFVAATVLLLSAQANADCAQTAETLSEVKRVYVGSLGDKQGTTELREKLIRRLRNARRIQFVESPSQADAILAGKATSAPTLSLLPTIDNPFMTAIYRWSCGALTARSCGRLS